MDILQLIKEEHTEINKLFPLLKDDDITQDWLDLYRKVSSMLTLHVQLEERYLLPEIEELLPVSTEFSNVARQNNLLMKEILSSIDKALGQKKKPVNKILEWVSALDEVVTKHLLLEEEIVLPKLRRLVSTREREEMGEVWNDLRDELSGAASEPMKKGKRSDGEQAAAGA